MNTAEKTVPKGKEKAARMRKAPNRRKEHNKQAGGNPGGRKPRDDTGRMYPTGARLKKTDRSCAAANGPRNAPNQAIWRGLRQSW